MTLLREVARSAIIGAIVGLLILGICGRGLMRIIAHWEGRVPSFTVSGSLVVVFAGTVAGLAIGIVHGVLRRYVRNPIIRNTIFVAACVVFTWFFEIHLLLRPRLTFVGLIIVYAIVLELSVNTHVRRDNPTLGSANNSQIA